MPALHTRLAQFRIKLPRHRANLRAMINRITAIATHPGGISETSRSISFVKFITLPAPSSTRDLTEFAVHLFS
ncbi:hypothetical protein CC78DRAFT_537974 [Lojkania enalia]|uniref:Uncharacterized protein n=1 Tax=Lojkania enalia TaxID=147567 RepID=A0A9P4MXF4_9PLEO|nr:hypothetical protein CC78DRAFT_537974 [Didymosphaeria enalia]